MRQLRGPTGPNYPAFSQQQSSEDDDDSWETYYSGNKRSQIGAPRLDNLGNTCYVNSVIQALMCVPPFTKYFTNADRIQQFTCRGQRLCLALAALLEDAGSRVNKHVEMESFKALVETAIPAFKGNDQQDAHEFLTLFLDGIHEELNCAPEKKEKISEPDIDGSTLESQRLYEAARAWGRYLRRNQSIIVDLFQGQIVSIVKCMKCNWSSATFDSFMYLPLTPTAITESLEQLLAESFEPEEMPDAKWNCENCKQRVGVSKRAELVTVPPVLIVQLKRFSYDKLTLRKIVGLCKAPVKDFNLAPFVPGSKQGLCYNLAAVIDHSGDPQSGHYTASIMRNDQWIFTDDTIARVAKEKEVINKDNYLLIYTRVPRVDRVKQVAAKPCDWPHKVDCRLL